MMLALLVLRTWVPFPTLHALIGRKDHLLATRLFLSKCGEGDKKSPGRRDRSFYISTKNYCFAICIDAVLFSAST